MGRDEMDQLDFAGIDGSVASRVGCRARVVKTTEMVTISKEEDEATVAWLEEALELANDRGRAKLAGLLKAVRDDIAFELELAEALSTSR
jgi:RNase P/RNase MRP subunit p29